MTFKDIGDRLVTTGLPVAYRHFKEDTPLPAIVYFVSEVNTFAADDKMYVSSDHIVIELYTTVRSPEIEASVETALDDIYWTKYITYLDSEKCYEIIYELEV